MFDILLAIYDTVGISFYFLLLIKLSFAGRQGVHIQMKTSSHDGTDVPLCNVIAVNISKRTFTLIKKIILFFTSHTTALLTHPLLKKRKLSVLL